MAAPTQPVTLTVEQIAELNRKLSEMRHDINNHLAMITASLELMRLKPDEAKRFAAMMSEQPMKIKNDVERFSSEFERALGISRKHPAAGSGWNVAHPPAQS